MVRKGSTIRDRVGEAYGNTFGRNQDSFMNRPNNKGPQISAKVLQSSQDKIIGHLKDAGVKAAPQLAQKIMQNVPMASKVGTMYNLLSPEQKQAITTVALKAFKGQPLPTTISKGDSVMNSSYGLSKAPNPKPVSLNSGILPNCYANDFMSPVAGSCVPMHMNCGTLQIPLEAAHPLNIYFLQTIAFDIQTRAQANVGFNLDIVTNLSSAKLLTAMNAAIAGLQVYFYYSSILSYESDPRNKNSAMIELRSRVTPQIISDMVQLGRRLEDTPIPPRIVEWVRYMSMNYLSGNSQGSPLIKLCPNVSCTEIAQASTTLPYDALALLTSADIVSTFTLIRRSIPQWRIGKLFDVPVIPCFDKDFITIFGNMGGRHHNGTAFKDYPSVSTVGSAYAYNSYNNKLDGAAYSMTASYDSNTSLWYPGLLQPNSTTTSFSRRSYYIVASVPQWINSVGEAFAVNSRQDSQRVDLVSTTTPINPHLYGAERVLGVNGSTALQTSRNFLDFLFNVDSIPLRGKLSHFNETSNNIIRYKV